MAPEVTTNTVRYKLRYIAFGLPHTWNLRFSRGTTGTGAQTAAATMADAILGAWPTALIASDFAWIEGLYSPEDDINFYPAGTLPVGVTGEYPAGTASPKIRSTYLKASGRGGIRTATLTMFGLVFLQDGSSDYASDGIITRTESARWGATIDAIAAANLVSVDNVVVSWKQRGNIKQHDYWRDELKPV